MKHTLLIVAVTVLAIGSAIAQPVKVDKRGVARVEVQSSFGCTTIEDMYRPRFLTACGSGTADGGGSGGQ